MKKVKIEKAPKREDTRITISEKEEVVKEEIVLTPQNVENRLAEINRVLEEYNEQKAFYEDILNQIDG